MLVTIFLYLLFIRYSTHAQQVRQYRSLNKQWLTVAHDTDSSAYRGFEKKTYPITHWKAVDVPHNWDAYAGYRRMLHGNRHGYAWYRKKFKIINAGAGKRYFLYFEGVGSYATIWLNGKRVGYHAGGRTTFTIDVTDAVLLDGDNLLAVRADHPANIRNLPWVCGGCSPERGFSEGSQPMGIFRPVHLLITDAVRVEPFGIHVWNDTTVNSQRATLHVETTVKNYDSKDKSVHIKNTLLDVKGHFVVSTSQRGEIQGGQTIAIKQDIHLTDSVHLWSPAHPYLYRLVTEISFAGKVIDRVEIPYGIRWISWPIGRKGNDKRFYINGEPFFINGVAEYEHLLGGSHAFSAQQITARVKQIQAAGFNAFRDAHQPHNLRYQRYWDSLGILSWTQMAAHIWFDNPDFRTNFKHLLTDWVKERRNSPSVILWGLENESTLPEDFARACAALIRQLDPTTSEQRKITTCNGGSGTDWDVPQNWTGTYGGDPATYATDLKKQLLVGEYGAWRTLDFHAEPPFDKETVNSEERMTQLMEMKVRLAHQVRDSVAGHFFWLFNSHENPGRIQGGEGLREMDRIGPVNYKGLFTLWDEPTDVFYMFRAHHTDGLQQPMVYIASHTWPYRWNHPGERGDITVYSNCDEVELFNDVGQSSFGRQKHAGFGKPFIWRDAQIRFNSLYAIGYIGGKAVARDTVVLPGLPRSPSFAKLYSGKEQVQAQPTYHYLYRVNCGGPDVTDHEGNRWMADRQRREEGTWGSSSWTAAYKGLPAMFASQRQTYDPIRGTVDWPLLQTFRYGREKLDFQFPVPNGTYLVELYFIEPWFGTGGGMDCTGWRLFDVAINDKTVEKHLDIWKEVGHDAVLKKTYTVQVKEGKIKIHFPKIAASQALISGIAIASKDSHIPLVPPSPGLIGTEERVGFSSVQSKFWLDIGDQLFTDKSTYFTRLPPLLYGAEWIRFPHQINQKPAGTWKLEEAADVFLFVPERDRAAMTVAGGFEHTQTYAVTSDTLLNRLLVYRKRFDKGASLSLPLQLGSKARFPIVLLPVTTLQSAHDLKPTTTYRPHVAKFPQTVQLTTFLDKPTLKVITMQPVHLSWEISTGVADNYSIMLRYANETSRILNGRMELCAADGTLLHTETIRFAPSKKGKWGYCYTTSGTMINAGKYVLKISTEDAKGLLLSNVEVQ